MVWAMCEFRALATIIDNIQEAIDFHEKLLIPMAKLALTDQLGQLLASGNKCYWPPSPYAGRWLQWCQDHVKAMKEIQRTNFYNFNDYSVWFTGEIPEGWVLRHVPWKTDDTAGIHTEWIFPDKPAGWVQGK